jgi:hypothetical protein
MGSQVQSLRMVYENEITKRYLAGVFLVVLGAGIIGGVFYFRNELNVAPFWVFIGLCVGRFGFFIGGDLGVCPTYPGADLGLKSGGS